MSGGGSQGEEKNREEGQEKDRKVCKEEKMRQIRKSL